MSGETLEEMLERNRFRVTKNETEILQKYDALFPKATYWLLKLHNMEMERGFLEMEMNDEQHELSEPVALAFLGEIFEAIAGLPRQRAEYVLTSIARQHPHDLIPLHKKREYLTTQLAILSEFYAADNGYSDTGKEQILSLIDSIGGRWPPPSDVTRDIIQIYAAWMSALHSGAASLHASLFQKAAETYHLPVPKRESGGLVNAEVPLNSLQGCPHFHEGILVLRGIADALHENPATYSSSRYPLSGLTEVIIGTMEADAEQKRECPWHSRLKLGSRTRQVLARIAEQQCETPSELVECIDVENELKGTGYRIRRKIAAGTFKDVYLAEGPDGNECVLKRMRDERVKEIMKGKISEREMVQKELKSSAFQMSHPNISPTMPLFHNKRMYILERKYERTLEDFVQEARREGSIGKYKKTANGRINGEWYRGPLPDQIRGEVRLADSDPVLCYDLMPAVAGKGEEYVLLHPYAERMIGFTADMASALYHCHEKLGIVHGDIKTDNVGIVIEKDGEEIAVINDFGMATYDYEVYGGDELRKGIGRVYTKPPQLFREGSHPTKMTDAWSFGAVLFFLVTGRYPFSEEPEDYSLPETRQKYLERVHALIREGKTEEVTAKSLHRYIPASIELPFHLYSRSEEAKHYVETGMCHAVFRGIIEFCFGLNVVMHRDKEHPFGRIKRDFEYLQERIKEKKEELEHAYWVWH